MDKAADQIWRIGNAALDSLQVALIYKVGRSLPLALPIPGESAADIQSRFAMILVTAYGFSRE